MTDPFCWTADRGSGPLLLELRVGGATHVYLLAAGEERALVVGSDPSADLCLSAPGIAPIHLHFEREADEIWIIPTASAGRLRMNASRVSGRCRVARRSLIELGTHSIEIRWNKKWEVSPKWLRTQAMDVPSLHAASQTDRPAMDAEYVRTLPDELDLTYAGVEASGLGSAGSNLPTTEARPLQVSGQQNTARMVVTDLPAAQENYGQARARTTTQRLPVVDPLSGQGSEQTHALGTRVALQQTRMPATTRAFETPDKCRTHRREPTMPTTSPLRLPVPPANWGAFATTSFDIPIVDASGRNVAPPLPPKPTPSSREATPKPPQHGAWSAALNALYQRGESALTQLGLATRQRTWRVLLAAFALAISISAFAAAVVRLGQQERTSLSAETTSARVAQTKSRSSLDAPVPGGSLSGGPPVEESGTRHAAPSASSAPRQPQPVSAVPPRSLAEPAQGVGAVQGVEGALDSTPDPAIATAVGHLIAGRYPEAAHSYAALARRYPEALEYHVVARLLSRLEAHECAKPVPSKTVNCPEVQ